VRRGRNTGNWRCSRLELTVSMWRIVKFEEGKWGIRKSGLPVWLLFFRYNLSNFLTTALPGKRLLDPFLLARLQIKGMFLHFLDDVFLLNLSLEAPQRILNRFTILYADFGQLKYTPHPLKIDPLLFPSLQSNVKPCAILRGLWRAVLCVRSVLPNGSAPPRKPVFVPYVADPGGKSTLTAQDPVITSWLVASTKATEESRILSWNLLCRNLIRASRIATLLF